MRASHTLDWCSIGAQVFNAFLEGELAATPAFAGLPARALKQLVTLLILEEYDAGTTLYTAGNPGDRVFLVMNGSVSSAGVGLPFAPSSQLDRVVRRSPS